MLQGLLGSAALASICIALASSQQLPTLPQVNLPSIAADFNNKASALCNSTGLCLPSKVVPPPPPPPPAVPVPAPVPAPAPSPQSVCGAGQVFILAVCATVCDLLGNPYIGLDCPKGGVCISDGDPVTNSVLQSGQGVLAIPGQGGSLTLSVTCAEDSDCNAGQFCAANGVGANICLDLLIPTGPFCYPGGSAGLRTASANSPV